ncbi:putative zinc metalloprotease EGY1, chloroplastic [Porphyridium purpureum]|uniref:Putative zinc metalloprotease EGY1, chloroplastic n=1 Tax=Porphyridium purpureum TaxID=35688 RepID=A0A5J4Z2W4_PORPP|nr:putative zinc metalloprotease EGY1, chloroplastic [Porphyridium purpureum]|eukprot:POR3250..scf295_1
MGYTMTSAFATPRETAFVSGVTGTPCTRERGRAICVSGRTERTRDVGSGARRARSCRVACMSTESPQQQDAAAKDVAPESSPSPADGQTSAASSTSASASSQKDAHGSSVTAQQMRMEAERLKLQALKAKLEQERAELAVERSKLERSKMGFTKNGLEAEESSSQTPGKTDNPVPATPTAEQSNGHAREPSHASKPDVELKTDLDQKTERLLKDIGYNQNAANNSSNPLVKVLLAANVPLISEEDVQELQAHVFGMGSFFVTKVIKSPLQDRVVFRGNMRAGMDSDAVFAALTAKMDEHKLSERVRLFLLEDIENDKRPVVIALPARATPAPSRARDFFAVVAGVLSLLTCAGYSVGSFGLNPKFMEQIAQGNTEELWAALPIALGTFGIMLAHDIAQRIVAAQKNIELGLPLFVPSLQLGTYGAITPFISFPKDRNDMFDVAAVGPLVGMILSLSSLVSGLYMSGLVSTEAAASLPTIPTALFHSSLLLNTFASSLLPDGLLQQSTISVHPLVVVGYTGALINALNLIPVGRLDGGRIVQSVLGRARAGIFSTVALALQGFSSILGGNSLLLIWGLITIFLQREPEIPCQNEISEPSEARSAMGTFLLALALLILLPVPGGIGSLSNLTGGGA